MKTPTTKFAVPFKAPCLTNSSQTSVGSQPLPPRSLCLGESTNHLPPSSDQQQQTRRCKDILSGLSQDSNISTQTFIIPVAYSPVATQSITTHNALLSRTHRRCRVTRKHNVLTHEANAQLSNNLEILATQIGKHRRDKPTTSTNINCTDVIQTGNKAVEAKRNTLHSNDVPIPPSAAREGTNDKAACQTRMMTSTADTIQSGPDVYEFFVSPTSQRKQRQKIRKLQARERMKRKLLELISKMHSEMQELRGRHRARCAAKHKGIDKEGKALYNTAHNRRKTPTYALVQASTACTTVSINKGYTLKPSSSVQEERVGFTDRGRGRKRLTGVEQ